MIEPKAEPKATALFFHPSNQTAPIMEVIFMKNILHIVMGVTLLAVACAIPGGSVLRVLVFASCGALASLIMKIK